MTDTTRPLLAISPSEDSFGDVNRLIKKMASEMKENDCIPKIATVIFSDKNSKGVVGVIVSNLDEDNKLQTENSAIQTSLELIHALSLGIIGERGANDIVSYLRVSLSQINSNPTTSPFQLQ